MAATQKRNTAQPHSPAPTTPLRSAEGQTHPPKVDGQTTTSPQRAEQRMHGAALTYNLTQELAALHKEQSWQGGDRNAKTLVQESGLRVVLVALRANARLAQHESHAQVTVQVVSGTMIARLEDRDVELPPHSLLSLEAGVSHELSAPESSAFLLTIAGTYAVPTGREGRIMRLAQARQAEDRWIDDGGHA